MSQTFSRISSPLTHSTLGTVASWLFLQYARHAYTVGLLHWLLSLPGMLFLSTVNASLLKSLLNVFPSQYALLLPPYLCLNPAPHLLTLLCFIFAEHLSPLYVYQIYIYLFIVIIEFKHKRARIFACFIH